MRKLVLPLLYFILIVALGVSFNKYYENEYQHKLEGINTTIQGIQYEYHDRYITVARMFIKECAGHPVGLYEFVSPVNKPLGIMYACSTLEKNFTYPIRYTDYYYANN